MRCRVTITNVYTPSLTIPNNNSVSVKLQGLLLQPREPLFYFPSLGMCLFWAPHVSGIMQRLSFCIRLTSPSTASARPVHAVACVEDVFPSQSASSIKASEFDAITTQTALKPGVLG